MKEEISKESVTLDTLSMYNLVHALYIPLILMPFSQGYQILESPNLYSWRKSAQKHIAKLEEKYDGC